MVDNTAHDTDRRGPFREECADVTRDLLAHDLVPCERQDTVRELLNDGKPAEALRIALGNDKA